MQIVQLILVISALVLFLLATFNAPSSRFSLGWAGLACCAGVYLLHLV